MYVRRLTRTFSGAALAVSLLLGGCAGGRGPAETQAAAADDTNDPLENVNRAIFDFNTGFDRYVLVPTAKGYRTVLPEPVRDSVRDFLANLRGPVILANDALQGQFRRAGTTAARFAINSTIGIGGLIDVAGRWGMPYHNEDFGQTLAVWGVPGGPFLMVPILGPSNPRDLAGMVAEGYADPFNIIAANNGFFYIAFLRVATSAVDTRSRNIETLAEIERTSLDYYAAVRSLYQQRRNAEVRNQDENLPTATVGTGGQANTGSK